MIRMLINTEFATCPACGGDLIAIAHSDLEILESGDIIVTQVGECDHCGNRYEWKEHYAYKGHCDIKGEE